MSTMFVSGRQLDHHTKHKGGSRAGVIPYTIKNGRIYFLLGVDRKTSDLTDFGGGVKCNETIVIGGLRELEEESCKLFEGVITAKDLRQSPALTNKKQNTVIFFAKIAPEWLDTAPQKFIEQQQSLDKIKKYNELSAVRWLNQDEFSHVAFNGKNHRLWRRIQNILRWNTSWSELRFILTVGIDLTDRIKSSWNNIPRPRYTREIMVSHN